MGTQNRTQQIYSFISAKLNPIAESLSIWLQKRWVRFFLQALIISFSIFYLYRNFQSVDISNLELKLDFIQLGWAFIITIGALFLGASGWWLTLKSAGQRIDYSTAIYIHLVSNLAKYIPGYAWQLLSKGYLTHKTGATTKVVGVSMTLELAQIFFSGIGLIILFIPAEFIRSTNFFWELNENIVIYKIGSLGFFALIVIVLLYLVTRMDLVNSTQRIGQKPLVFALLTILIGWLFFGVAFWMIGDAIQPISIEYIPLFVFTLVTSFLIGLLIIIIPASVGIREGVMVFFLGNFMPAPIAVLVATISRIVLTICELFSAGVVYLYSRWSKKQGEYLANLPK